MPLLRRAGILAVLAGAYFAAGRLGLSLAFVNESATAIWPPSGIAIAACLLWGPQVWPGVLAGAFLVNLANTGVPLASLLIACGNTLEALAAGVFVRRYAGGAAVFDETKRIFLFVAAAAGAASVAATLGLLALVLSGLVDQPAHGMTWITWWTGDLAGALLVAPALIGWATPRHAPLPWIRRIEAAVLFAALIAISYFVFGPTAAGARNYPLMFAVLPPLIWAALRFGQRAATAAILVTSVGATVGTLQGLGPFARESPNESLLLLQAYLCVKMITMLSLAAEVAARRGAERQLRDLNEDLAGRVESRSRELERLHGRLVEAQHVAHIGSWEWDVPTNSIWWSDEMYHLYGLPPGSPVSYERFLEHVHADDRGAVHDVVARSGRTGEPFAFEHRVVTPSGVERVLHAQGHVVLGGDGKPLRMFGIGHDVTERKRAEEERLQLAREQAARREAEDASRLKDQFLATLSHELRTPLNSIVGWAELLGQHPSDEPLRRRAVDAIQRNVAIQAQLVSDILDISRINSGAAIALDRQTLPVASVIEAAAEVVGPALEARHIELVVSVPSAAAVFGDSHRLQQVFWNVLANAAKFVPDRGHITVRAEAGAGSVRIRVEDDGPGIDEAFLPRIFEQFTQADSSLTRQHGGLGLGLTISRSLVELHGGTITAANRPEGGAVFVVELPAADASAIAQARAARR
jgi:PAS domain S-box-containing protein